LSDFFAHFSKTVRDINNLYQMLKIGVLRSTANSVIESKKTPTLRFETRQGKLWAEVFQFDAVASK